MLWGEKPYYSLDYYLKQTFGSKTYKASLDAGFTCPNRDGTIGRGGCIFCSRGGSGEFAGSRALSIKEQIDSQIEKLGSQAWLLFGEDLKSANYSLESFQTELKKDIKEWNDKGRYVSDYKVESNSDIDYVTYGGGIQAAIVTVVIYVRNGSDLIPVSHDFMLGKDSGGKWKILSWRESKTSQEAVNEN